MSKVQSAIVSLATIHNSERPFARPRLRLWIRLRLAWPLVVLTIAHALHMPRGVSDMTEPEAESNDEAAIFKRVSIYFTEHNLIVFHQLHSFSIHSALTL